MFDVWIRKLELKDDSSKKYIAFVVLVIFSFSTFLSGLFWVGRDIKNIRKASASHKWFETEGFVLESQTRVQDSYGITPGMERISKVLYQYRVDDQVYTSTNVALFENLSQSHTQDTLKRYPSGAWITVYFNPFNHAESVLEKENPSIFYLPLVVSIILVVIGVFSFVFLVKVWLIIEDDWKGESW